MTWIGIPVISGVAGALAEQEEVGFGGVSYEDVKRTFVVTSNRCRCTGTSTTKIVVKKRGLITRQEQHSLGFAIPLLAGILVSPVERRGRICRWKNRSIALQYADARRNWRKRGLTGAKGSMTIIKHQSCMRDNKAALSTAA